MPKAELDKQGKLFWHHAMVAGWTAERITRLLMKRWQVTHWNALSYNEKRQALGIMKAYSAKAVNNAMKRKRQLIMKIVSAAGKDIAWLHENMVAWGYGESMRSLDNAQLNELYTQIVKLFPRAPKQAIKTEEKR